MMTLEERQVKMIEGSDFRVIFLPFTGDIKGATRVDEDGFATIYINEALAPDAKKDTLKHEIRHIERNDFYNDLTIYEVEAS